MDLIDGDSWRCIGFGISGGLWWLSTNGLAKLGERERGGCPSGKDE